LVARRGDERVLMPRSAPRTPASSRSYPSPIRRHAIDRSCTDASAAQTIVGVCFGAARFFDRVTLHYFFARSWCDTRYLHPTPAGRAVDRPKYIKWCTRGELGHFRRRVANSARLVIAGRLSRPWLSSPAVNVDGSPVVTIRLDFRAFASGLKLRQSCVGSK
jgi:hypothetical protein